MSGVLPGGVVPPIPLFKVLMTGDAGWRLCKTLDSGYIGEGPRVAEFEHAFARAIGTDAEILALNSATSAIDLALHMIGVGPGDEVITTPMTCTATNAPIVTRGAVPVWADVDPLTGLLDANSVATRLTDRTRAIIAVDWSGRSCNYGTGPGGLRGLLYSSSLGGDVFTRSIPVIQDAAHVGPAPLRGRRTGDYVVWSFQAIKHLTTGDGGALLTADVDRARLLRWYGLDRRSNESFRCAQNIREIGYKYHMNDLAASIGLANLDAARWAVDKHREHARYYQEVLGDIPPEILTLPPPDDSSSWWLYCVLVEEGRRDAFIEYMGEAGITCSPVHGRNDTHTAFIDASRSPSVLPGVDAFSAREVAIPVGWWLSDELLDYIAGWVRQWAKIAESHKGREHAKEIQPL